MPGILLALALLLLLPATGSAADVGDECKLGFGVAPQYLCPTGKPCLKAISKMYCSNAGMICGWSGTGGYVLNQTKTYQGKTYECTATGFQRQNAQLGQECRVGASVPREYLCETGKLCLQGTDKKYCSNAGKVCGWQGTGGYTLGQQKTHQGKSYDCTATGFQRSPAGLGQECKVGSNVPREFLCQPGKLCLQSIDKKYCSNVGKVCGWQSTAGYTLGQKKSYQGKTYACTATGFDEHVESVAIGGGTVTTLPTTPQIRQLTSAEIRVARGVFGSSLNYGSIRVTNTVGSQSRPWTTNSPPLYTINVGVVAYKGLSNRTWSGLLIHELTHVWQGQHGVPFMSNSAWHQTVSAIGNGGDTGKAYDYKPGGQWSKYNAEQQASIVEDWYRGGRSSSSNLYPYIRDNVRPGKPNGTTSLK